MNRDTERSRQFTRRAAIVGIAQASLFLILTGRLGYLQFAQKEKFQTLSDRNRISLRIVPAVRGEVMDRFGVPLALNNQNFRALVVPEQTENLEQTLRKLAQLIPYSEPEIKQTLREAERVRPFTPLMAQENLNWDDMARIELNLPDLAGVSIDEGFVRSYPFGSATAHVIGYVGRVSAAEKTDDPIMDIPGFRIGKQGIEKTFDLSLRGTAGEIKAEVNASGREIRELGRKPAKAGERLTLALDADLQMQCQEILSAEKSAAAVVMDAHSGEIYALCSHPSFDPNVFSKGIPADLWEELLADDAHPLTNKPVSGQYPPGSTFKMVTALAVLEAGISPGMEVYCPGHYMLGGNKFHCWKKGGHGNMNVVEALAQSCDTYFYEVGKRIGIDAIARMARRFGFGEKQGIEIPGERPGLMPDRAWKMKKLKQTWQQGETLNCAIGQGHVLATPLQLATMTARLVNGGMSVTPRLLRSTSEKGSVLEKPRSLGFDPRHLMIIRKGMDDVVNNEKGTAYAARITEDGMAMGGKTGTAQVRRITAQQRAMGVKNEDLPWRQRHHALFVGYAPIQDPKYIVSVIVEHGVGGSKAAAPMARDLLRAVQKRDPRRLRAVDDPENNVE